MQGVSITKTSWKLMCWSKCDLCEVNLPQDSDDDGNGDGDGDRELW